MASINVDIVLYLKFGYLVDNKGEMFLKSGTFFDAYF